MRLCFVSYEIFPTVGGGVGSLIHDLLMHLPDDHEAVLLLDFDRQSFEKFCQVDRLLFPAASRITAFLAADLADAAQLDRAQFASEFEFRSCRFAAAVRALHERATIDYLEFFDYCGVAWVTLSDRLARPALYPGLITIRLHNTVEIIDTRTYGVLQQPNAMAYILERMALPLADAIVSPGKLFFEQEYVRRYNLSHQPMVIGMPPCKAPTDSASAAPSPGRRILFYGRQSKLKGLDLFLAAAVQVLRDHDFPDLVFTIVGPVDNVTDTKVSLPQYVPAALLKYFELVGSIDRRSLPSFVQGSACGVFASRTESYCYALHEVYQLGLPVILNDIPAFRDYFASDSEALFFDGKVGDLANQLVKLLASAELRARLAERPPQRLERYAGTGLNAVVEGARVAKTTKQRLTPATVTNYVLHTGRWNGPPTTAERLASVTRRTVHLVPGTGAQDDVILLQKRWRIAGTQPGAEELTGLADVVVFSLETAFTPTGIEAVVAMATQPLGANVVMTTMLAGPRSGWVPTTITWGLDPRNARQAPMAFFALWNWSPLCLVDLSALLRAAHIGSLIEDLAHANTVTPVIVPSDVLGVWHDQNLSPTITTYAVPGIIPDEMRAAPATLDLHISLGALGDDILTTIWRATEATRRDRALVYLINPGPGAAENATNDVWLIGVPSNANTVVFQGQIFGLEGQIDAVDANHYIPLDRVHLKQGLVHTHLWSGDSISLLGHEFSGNVVVVRRGRVWSISLFRKKADILRISFMGSEEEHLQIDEIRMWQSALAYGAANPPPAATIMWTETAPAGEVVTRNRGVDGIEAAVQQLQILARIAATDVEIKGAMTLVSQLLATLPRVGLALRPRVMLDGFDFWNCTPQDQAALETLIATYRLWRETCELTASSQQLRSYLSRVGIALAVDYPHKARPLAIPANARTGRSLLVVAVPGRVSSIAHMLGGIGMLNARGENFDVKVVVAEPGTATWNPEFVRNISISALELHELGAAGDFDAVICCYPYAALPDTLRDLHAAGAAMVVGVATAANLQGGHVVPVLLWEDPGSIADAIRQAVLVSPADAAIAAG